MVDKADFVASTASFPTFDFASGTCTFSAREPFTSLSSSSTVTAAEEAFVVFLRVGFLVSSISCTSCTGFAFFADDDDDVVVVVVAADAPVDFLAAADPLPRVFAGAAAASSRTTTLSSGAAAATFFGRPLFFAATSDMVVFCDFDSTRQYFRQLLSIFKQ